MRNTEKVSFVSMGSVMSLQYERQRATSSSSAGGSSSCANIIRFCNVRNIRDLAILMKTNSHKNGYMSAVAGGERRRSSVSSLSSHTSDMSTSTSNKELLLDLHSKLSRDVDRNEFRKQMDNSRVIGKEVSRFSRLMIPVHLISS
jgi:hypothetical protein